MRRIAIWTGLAATLAVGVHPAAAQLGVGVKAGTTGVGAEAAFGITSRLAVRGSATMFPTEPSGSFSDVDYTVELPSPLFTVGADLYPFGGGFRIMGGLLIGAEQTNLLAEYTGTVELGNQEFSASELGDLRGVFTTSNAAPFVGIGFGKHFGRGLGLTLDLGVAFLGDPELRFSTTGPCNDDPVCGPQLRAAIAEEEAAVQDDLDKYARYFPILSLGLKFGLF